VPIKEGVSKTCEKHLLMDFKFIRTLMAFGEY